MTGHRVRDVLELDAWFSGLPEHLKALMLDHGAVRRFRANELVFAAGDDSSGQFCLISGQVNLVHSSTTGKQMVHGLFRPGSWFGYLSVLDAQPRFQDAMSATQTELFYLSTTGFRRIVKQNPEYYEHFALLLCRSVRLTLSMLVDYRTTSFSSRLAALLLDMSLPQDAVATPKPSAPRLTQEGLAGIVGASRQTVNRQLRDWQTKNFVRLGYGLVTVIDRVGLASVSRGDERQPHLTN
jgi:CRP/FNR family cyclic AMP-dependent transcriptional regulator